MNAQALVGPLFAGEAPGPSEEPGRRAGEGAGAALGRGLRVILAGGGTGGHLFPGIALAEEVVRRGGEVLFVGTARGIEARVVPELGYGLRLIDASGIKGRGLAGLLRGLWRLPRAWWQCRAILREFAPDVVVGVGGYASGPLVATASLSLLRLGKRIPAAIMEQNSIPGITNRILGRLVGRIFAAFPDPRGFFPAGKIALTGNPIRQGVLASLRKAEATAEQAQGRGPRLFVFGGSQGARAINDAVLAATPRLLELAPGLEIWHQTGKAAEAEVRAGYATLGLAPPRAQVSAFITDMAAAYRWGDLVLCRAGATSLAELSAVGKPAVLVPFPHATDNHQEHNASSLVAAGAALLMRESEWTPEGLATTLAALLTDRARLASMGAAMLAAARPEAASVICDELAAMAGR
ncbi:MAG: undecaprenyldiphospho-muramoylpentapeptide beta-N-acetylglucosaminyltransferase [Nannocystis sp.]|nr:undecaprenyldiphospho-muramoylpentapeptide beta-N-acetylglucosaminyltransferase [Nannocystis sp.]